MFPFDASNIFDLLIAVGTMGTLIVLSITLYVQIQDRKPKFTYERLRENDNWKIMILHPDKPIHVISVTLNDKQLRLANSQNYERTMRVGEGQNFEVGVKPDDDATVVIKYDKYRITKKWRKIPLYGNF